MPTYIIMGLLLHQNYVHLPQTKTMLHSFGSSDRESGAL